MAGPSAVYKIVSFSNLYKSGDKKFSQTVNLEFKNEKNKNKLVSLSDKSGPFFEVRASGKNSYNIEIQFDRLETLSDGQLSDIGINDRISARQKGKVSLPIKNINVIDSTLNGTDKGFQIVLKGGIEIRSNARGVEIKKAGETAPLLRTKPTLEDDTFSISITENCIRQSLDSSNEKVTFNAIRKDGHAISIGEDISVFSPNFIFALEQIVFSERLKENTQSTVSLGNVEIMKANIAGFGGDSSVPTKISNEITLIKQNGKTVIYHNGSFVDIDYIHAYNYPTKKGDPSLNCQLVIKPRSKNSESFRIPLAIELEQNNPKTSSNSYTILNEIADFLGVTKIKEPTSRKNLINLGRLKSEQASVFSNNVKIINTKLYNRSLKLTENDFAAESDFEDERALNQEIDSTAEENAEINANNRESIVEDEVENIFSSAHQPTNTTEIEENTETFYDIPTNVENIHYNSPNYETTYTMQFEDHTEAPILNDNPSDAFPNSEQVEKPANDVTTVAEAKHTEDSIDSSVNEPNQEDFISDPPNDTPSPPQTENDNPAAPTNFEQQTAETQVEPSTSINSQNSNEQNGDTSSESVDINFNGENNNNPSFKNNESSENDQHKDTPIIDSNTKQQMPKQTETEEAQESEQNSEKIAKSEKQAQPEKQAKDKKTEAEKKNRYWPKVLSALGGILLLGGFVVLIALGLSGIGLAIGGALIGVGVASNIVGKSIPLEYNKNYQSILRNAEKFAKNRLKRFKELTQTLFKTSKRFFKRNDRIKKLEKELKNNEETIRDLKSRPKSTLKRSEKKLLKKYLKQESKIQTLKIKQRNTISNSNPRLIENLKKEHVARFVLKYKDKHNENPSEDLLEQTSFEFIDKYRYDIVHCLKRNSGKTSAKKAIQKMSIAERCLIEEADHHFNEALSVANAKFNPSTIKYSNLIAFGPKEEDILGPSITKYFTMGKFTERQTKLANNEKARPRRIDSVDVVIAERSKNDKTQNWVGTFSDKLTSLELQQNAVDGLLEDNKKMLEKADELLSGSGRNYLSNERRNQIEKELKSYSTLNEEKKIKTEMDLEKDNYILTADAKEAKKIQRLRASDIARGR